MLDLAVAPRSQDSMDSEITQRLPALTPIVRVLARVDAVVRPVNPREAAAADAEGRVLAADAAVGKPHPPTAVALHDGWAVRAESIADAGPYTPMPVAPVWVDTGEPMPAGTDAVLPRDAVMLGGGSAEALGPATAGDGVLMAGADAAPDAPLRRAGERLRAVDVAALQAAGIARVSIREPRVRVVAMPGCDTVALAISRAVSAQGANVIFVRALERALADEQTDAVITIGGTGEGQSDASVAMLARMGQVDVHGFGIAPGESAALGVAAGHPVLMLPRRLDGALAAFLMVGEPLLARLTGLDSRERGLPVTLTRKIVSTVGIAEVVPVRRVAGGVEPLAAGHWPLQALTRADGYVIIAPESEGLAAGGIAEMRTFP
jgi:molybdopterin biosynthesis enzyme